MNPFDHHSRIQNSEADLCDFSSQESGDGLQLMDSELVDKVKHDGPIEIQQTSTATWKILLKNGKNFQCDPKRTTNGSAKANKRRRMNIDAITFGVGRLATLPEFSSCIFRKIDRINGEAQ
jgi:hypothetical protein